MTARRPPRGLLRGAAVAALFAALAVLWSWPLVRHPGADLPGAGIGDNAMFLWNFWWMRTALARGTSFFHTDRLFAPAGVDLTLHTHTALPAYVGATALGRLPLLTALNVTIVAGLALNGFCAYLLARRFVRDRGAAILAGVVFGSSPFVAAHLNGHFNLTMAWTVPLFALTALRAREGSVGWSVLSGVVLGLTAYVDYYFVVYEGAFALVLAALAARDWSIRWEPGPARPRWLWALVVSLVAIDAAAIASIVLTGGYTIRLGPIRVLMDGLFNPLQILWAAVLLAAWMRLRPRLERAPGPMPAAPTLRPVAIALGVSVLVAAPIAWRGIQLVAHGQYVTQRYSWRSGPSGVDVATLLLGDPFQGTWGAAVRHAYARLGIDVIESGAWLGVAPVLLAACALLGRRRERAVRLWAATGLVFFVWALGPHLRAFGWNTGMILPQAVLRFVPIVANARMPGRAMVMVYLALAMLAAIGLAEWRAASRRPAGVLAVALAAVLIDFLPAPFPVTPVACPAIDTVLRDRPERGAVATLPLGVADGFGDVTPFDRRILACQPVHGRPIVGGFVARLPPAVMARYRADPLLAAWLRLSGARPGTVDEGPLPDRDTVDARLRADGIGLVLLDERRATPALRAFVERGGSLTPVASDDGYVLLAPAAAGLARQERDTGRP